MFEQAFKNIDDILHKDAGCTGELDYTEQSSWLLFLKYLDALEADKATDAALEGKPYSFILDERFRWGSWAAPRTAAGALDHNAAMTGDDLREFVNGKLFPYLAGFKQRASGPNTSGKIDWHNVKYIDEKQHKEMHRRLAPKMGDILLAKNGNTGVAAIVDRDTTFDIYVSLAMIRSRGAVLPRFLLHFINSPVAKMQFNKRLKGVGVPNLHLEEIREVLVQFPERQDEQQEVIARLDELRRELESLGRLQRRKLAALDELKKSLLHQAFSGTLTDKTVDKQFGEVA